MVFGVPFTTGLWLWIIPVILLLGQFVYCWLEDRKNEKES